MRNGCVRLGELGNGLTLGAARVIVLGWVPGGPELPLVLPVPGSDIEPKEAAR
jgi:hypothetical protein